MNTSRPISVGMWRAVDAVMSLPSRLLCLALLLTTFAARARAWDVSLGGERLRLNLSSASAAGKLAPRFMLDAQRAALSITPASAAALPSAQAKSAAELDLDVRRSMAHAGYALSLGLGLTVGALALAVRPRPRSGAPGVGICHEDRVGDRPACARTSSL